MAERKTTNWSKRILLILAVSLAGLVLLGIAADALQFWEPKASSDVAPAPEQAEQSKQEEAQEKLGYEIGRPAVLPGVPEVPQQLVKPGHWSTIDQRMKANLSDFVGQSRMDIVNERNTISPIPDTPFELRATRPVTLTKGRPKEIETTLFVPPTEGKAKLSIELRERGLGYGIQLAPVPLVQMPSYQYYFVVLAKEPSRYSMLKTLDSFAVPFEDESESGDTENTLHYQVVQPNLGRVIPLSDNPLTWTSIAYILWDEVDPQQFTLAQQQALINWLQWGGQLVINGPDSLDLLKGSFLEPYLPATSGGSKQITRADLDEFNRGWTIVTGNTPAEPLAPTVPWSGIELRPRPEAQPIPWNGGLLVERSIGRGRIVVSAMQLTERELVNWRDGFESWFNACVLRRPPRKYSRGYFGDPSLNWADEKLAKRRLDARLTSRLRYFARDLGTETSYQYVEVPAYDNSTTSVEYRPPQQAGGIGAWNDFNATADAARAGLKQEAGIDVPSASFVIMCLAVYLIALVPLNWLVFHAFRRVELAWLAAPVLAVAATFLVVQQAQLDIGFVRSQTEIGVLELQPAGIAYEGAKSSNAGAPRGHLTRYTAFYTSLSANYEIEFDELTALAAPFPASSDFQLLSGQTRDEVDFQRYDKVRLAGLPILSNSTSMVHSEQMFALDGPIQLGFSKIGNSQRIENRSQMHLQSVGIIRRPAAGEETPGDGGLLGMWVGDLPPAQSAPLTLLPLDVAEGQVAFAAERQDEAQRQSGQPLDLEPMFALAYDEKNLEPGEVRLVARVDEILPGEIVSPEASQTRGATLVLAHLKYGPLPPPLPDLNTRQSVMNN